MPSVDPSIETTVRHLESVTVEIANLRDAVAGHRNAALGLEAVAATLSSLSQQLQRLPTDVKSEFAGISDLVTQSRDALRPAGTLEGAIRELARGNEQLSADLQREREILNGEMRSFRQEIGGVRALINEQFQQSHADIKNIAEQVSRSDSQLAELRKGLDRFSSTQARDAEAIKTRLAKLTGLARRGFFALLRGKDAPADPL